MIKAAHAIGLERLGLERIRNHVERLLGALEEAAEAERPAAPGAWSPPVDLCETLKEITVRVELPGVRPETLSVRLTAKRLRITGEKRKRPARQRVLSHLCSERSYGRFDRIVPLRWSVSVRETTAELSNGVLVIRLPKVCDRRGAEFKVPVREADGGG